MKLALGAMALSAALASAQPQVSPLKVLINPGDSAEQSRVTVYGAWKTALEQALRKERIASATMSLSNDATADLGATRSRIQDIFVAPAHVIGSALRYGYTPVLGLERPVQAVLVAPQASPVSSLAQAAGKRLGLPMQDSVVTYLLRGEVNAANTTIKKHFGALYETRYQDALLPCLQLQRCDLVAVERSVFERWVAAGEPLKIVLESKPVPGLSVAIRDGARPSVAALDAALTEALAGNSVVKADKVISLHAADFDYVATLGYFTPRDLPGAQVVDPAAVAQLLQGGAVYIDTRTDAEFKAGRVPGSKLVPYGEKSPKEADFDPKLDQFDLSKLPQERDAVLIFACNGAECWKSFKASHAALKAGYKRVYWFRGGLPAWRAAGLKTEAGA
ncbi:MAG: rhodanese-like domain-containing protein [Hylemonella sp.]|nr:rhodanese-like domain-containing protein [Hylemonella sp.]